MQAKTPPSLLYLHTRAVEMGSNNIIKSLVFVHGLSGHRIKSWTSIPTEEMPEPKCWPEDLFPTACPTARILAFGYDAKYASFYFLSGPDKVPQGTTINDHSAELLLALGNYRAATQTPHERPIIFVCHSLGGLVVANALSRQQGASEANKSLVASVRGAMFFGTPFEGSDKACWGRIGVQLLTVLGLQHNGKLKELEERSEIACFFEEYPTYVKGAKVGLVVEKQSASLKGVDPIPIPSTHSGMCKFVDEYRKGYQDAAGTLQRWIQALSETQTSPTRPVSVIQGRAEYHGEIKGNRGGDYDGNVYGATPKANIITGSRNTYYHGAGESVDSDDD